MDKVTDTAKARVQAALLIKLQDGAPLTKIKVEPMSREFELGCEKDKVGLLIEEIVDDARLKEKFIEYLLGQLDHEFVKEVRRGMQDIPKKKPREKAAAKPSAQKPRTDNMPSSPTLNEKDGNTEPKPWEPRVVEGNGPPDVSKPPSISDSGPGRSENGAKPPNLTQVHPAPYPTGSNDDGASLDEGVSSFMDAVHIFVTSEPSLVDIQAVTRYLRSATRVAKARGAG